MTPNQVLKAKSPEGAAKAFHAWLCAQAIKMGCNTANVYLWSPEDTAYYGWGSGWAVAWEEGPHEWTSVTGGCTLTGPEQGIYSTPGPFPKGLSGPGWLAEPYNHFVLNFSKW